MSYIPASLCVDSSGLAPLALRWDTADAEFKVQELTKVLPLKLGLGQNIAMRDLLTAQNVFLVLTFTFTVRSPLFFPDLCLHVFQLR